MTNKVLANKNLVPNQTLKSMIIQYMENAAATNAKFTEEALE